MDESPNSSWREILVQARWPLALCVLGLIGLAAYLASVMTTKRVYDQTLDRGLEVAVKAAASAAEIAGQFRKENITSTFYAALPKLSPAGMGNLEVAVLEQTEILRQEDNLSVFWDKISLGTTVTEIRAPVTYRYHVKLSDPWRLDVSNQTCIVYAPRIRASLPPAIHTDRIEKHQDNGWARMNARAQMEELERSLTPTLSLYAMDRDRIDLIRDHCRGSVAEFIKSWLLREDQWRTDRFHSVRVIFQDEDEPLDVGHAAVRIENSSEAAEH